MKLSMGILAHNEAQNLTGMLESLFQQSLFSDYSGELEIIVVANGCTDKTAAIARQVLNQLSQNHSRSNLTWQVQDIQEPGKCNAWNLFVHQFSSPSAELLCLADADITFLDRQTLLNMVNVLIQQQEAWVATDMPVKDIAVGQPKGLMQKMFVSASDSNSDRHAICGQLYCSKADVLRKIMMPGALPVEDGFLRAMVLTNFFTEPENFDRIQRSSEARHIFEAVTNIFDLIRHETRLVVGNSINSFLFVYFWENCKPEVDAAYLVRQHLDTNPSWLSEFVQQEIKKRGWWLIPPSLVFKRFERLRNLTLPKAIVKFPIALLAFLVDAWVAVDANRKLHQSGGVGLW